MVADLQYIRQHYPELSEIEDQVVLYALEVADMFVPVVCKNAYLQGLMAAHLLYIRERIERGEGTVGAIVTGVREELVSISYAAPSDVEGRSLWYQSSPYGQNYYAAENRCIDGLAAAGVVLPSMPNRWNL